jgi:hypothetical protein
MRSEHRTPFGEQSRRHAVSRRLQILQTALSLVDGLPLPH